MSIKNRRFISCEDGAVTIDWVALAAGLMILGVGIMNLFSDELQSVVDEIETQLASATAVSAPVDNNGGGGGGTTFNTGVSDGNGGTYVASAGDMYFDHDGNGAPSEGDFFAIDTDGVGGVDTYVEPTAATQSSAMSQNSIDYHTDGSAAADGWSTI